MALLTHFSSVADHTSISPSSDSIGTLRKKAFENSSTNLSMTKQLDQKIRPFWPDTQAWPTIPPRCLVAIP
jgi:hypothetical protein